MRANSVARRYARATFEVALEKGASEAWLFCLEEVAAALADSDVAQALRSPNIPESKKAEVIETAFPDLAPEIRNLVRLLIARGRIDILPGICVAFSEYLDEALGRVDADVTSARALDSTELTAIQQHLSRRTGKSVTVKPTVDSSLIGGIVMRIGDEVIDASVATRLERLRQRLA